MLACAVFGVLCGGRGDARAEEPSPSNTAPPGPSGSVVTPQLSPTMVPTYPPAPDAETTAAYVEARKLLGEGNWTDGCKKIESIRAKLPTARVTASVAECREHEGKLEEAHALLRQAIATNQATFGDSLRDDTEKWLQNKLASVHARLAKLNIVVDGTASGMKVRRDGEIVPEEAFGKEILLNPGTHEVIVETPARPPQRIPVTLAEGEKRIIHVKPAPSVESGASKYAGAIVCGSVAVALGGITAGLGAWTMTSHHDLVTKCAEGLQACKGEASALEARGTATNVVLGFASATAVTAGVLFLVERSKSTNVEVALSPNGGLVRMRW